MEPSNNHSFNLPRVDFHRKQKWELLPAASNCLVRTLPCRSSWGWAESREVFFFFFFLFFSFLVFFFSKFLWLLRFILESNKKSEWKESEKLLLTTSALHTFRFSFSCKRLLISLPSGLCMRTEAHFIKGERWIKHRRKCVHQGCLGNESPAHTDPSSGYIKGAAAQLPGLHPS